MSYKSSYTGAQIDAGIAAANTAVQPTRTVNGHALSADVTVTATDVGLGNVTNESKATMFSTPTFTGNAALSDGNFVVGTSGKGIDFSATANATGMTSELLDDYEEGTYTATLTPFSGSGSITLGTSNKLAYTKIGRKVHVQGLLVVDSVSSPTGTAVSLNLPMYSANDLSAQAGRYSGGSYLGGLTSGSGVKGILGYEESLSLLYFFDASTVQAGSQFWVSFNYVTSS